MVRRRASTCFAFMLPKNQVGAVDLFAGTEGDTARGVSQQGTGVSSFAISGPSPAITLTRSSPVPSAEPNAPMAGRLADGACRSAKLPSQVIFTMMARPFARLVLAVEA
jgi:hypothetical protein